MASDTDDVGWMQDILPDQYNYKIVGGNVCENESGDLKFEVGVNATTESEVKHFCWLHF